MVDRKNPAPINKISNKILTFMPKVIFLIIFPCGKRLSYTEKRCKFLNATTLDFQLAEINEVALISKRLGIFISVEVLW